MDPTELNAAVAALRKAGKAMETLDLVQVEANALHYGTGLSRAGQEADDLKGRREEVRAAIRELARVGRSYREAHRKLEDLLG